MHKRKSKTLDLAKNKFVLHNAAKPIFEVYKTFNFQVEPNKIPQEVINHGQYASPLYVIKSSDVYHYFANWAYLAPAQIKKIKTLEVFLYEGLSDKQVQYMAVQSLVSNQLIGHDKDTNLIDLLNTLDCLSAKEKRAIFDLKEISSSTITLKLTDETIGAARYQKSKRN